MSLKSNIKPILFLFTSKFPYTKGETFVANELPILSEKFSKIYLVPNSILSSQLIAQVPENIEIINIQITGISFSKKLFCVLKNCIIITQVLFLEVFYSRQKKQAFFNLQYNFHYLLTLFLKEEKLMPFIKANPGSFYYTYWFSTSATMLSLLIKKNKIPAYVSRAHGFDLYEDTGKINYIPFRKFQLENVNHVYCVSKIGRDYLKKIYPSYSQKISKSYLGVYDHGINPIPENDEIVLVSCSNVIKLKRVHLIAEALKRVKVTVKWVHFGDGNLKAEIEKTITTLPENIKVELRGVLDNKEIMSFYKHNAVSLFVNTSISEGIPVSIMEAISFGIPVFATNVGGVSEIVNHKTGALVDANFNVDELSQFINTFNESKYRSPAFRKEVHLFWAHNFSAVNNYNAFVDEVFQI